jgi:hypothetical protein
LNNNKTSPIYYEHCSNRSRLALVVALPLSAYPIPFASALSFDSVQSLPVEAAFQKLLYLFDAV